MGAVEGFDPREVNFNFTEANGWQYLFAPAHDVAGQKDILGGDEGYLNRLNALFTAPIQTTGRIQLGHHRPDAPDNMPTAWTQSPCGVPRLVCR